MKHTQKMKLKQERGSALIFAIGILAIFSVLALNYVKSAEITLDTADYDVRVTRAREAAAAGVYAAVGDLQKVVKSGRVNDALGTASIDLPTYGAINEGNAPTLQEYGDRKAVAQVSLADESGRVNLNHAPASVLQAVLGVDGATARAIAGSLPSAGAPGGQWLATPEDLVSRKLLTADQFAAIDPALVTTLTVVDHSHAEKYLNVNQASPKTLAALFGVPLEVAQKAYDKRPYTSLDGLLGALGKLPPAPTATPAPAPGADPAAAPVVPAPAPAVEPPVPAAVTSALSFESHSFRIVSDGKYINSAAKYHGPETHARVEAVVDFDDKGNYTIVSWSEETPDTAKSA